MTFSCPHCCSCTYEITLWLMTESIICVKLEPDGTPSFWGHIRPSGITTGVLIKYSILYLHANSALLSLNLTCSLSKLKASRMSRGCGDWSKPGKSILTPVQSSSSSFKIDYYLRERLMILETGVHGISRCAQAARRGAAAIPSMMMLWKAFPQTCLTFGLLT